jgi:hypothetical protein
MWISQRIDLSVLYPKTKQAPMILYAAPVYWGCDPFVLRDAEFKAVVDTLAVTRELCARLRVLAAPKLSSPAQSASAPLAPAALVTPDVPNKTSAAGRPSASLVSSPVQISWHCPVHEPIPCTHAGDNLISCMLTHMLPAARALPCCLCASVSHDIAS